MTIYGILWIILGIAIYNLFADSVYDIAGEKAVVVFFLILFGFIGYKAYYNTTDEAFAEARAEEKAKNHAAEKRIKEGLTPKLVSADENNCKIYSFIPENRYNPLYYTVCPTSSTMFNEHNESCGKSCSKLVVEPITTEFIDK